MDPNEYRAMLGLSAPEVADEVDPIDSRLYEEAQRDPLAESDIDTLATQPQDPDTVPFDDWEEADKPGLIGNSLRLAAERGSKLLGHAFGHAGKIGRRLEAKYPAGEILFGTDWGPDDPADGKFRVRYMTP